MDGALVVPVSGVQKKEISGFLYGHGKIPGGSESEAEAAGHCHASTALLASRPTRA